MADIVDGVTKISMIVFENKEEAQAENIRKMILAMSHDMRVLMVKLADRLHNMSTLDFQKPHKQRRIAQETMDIYAPLANRLGLYLLKRQLEDLSFKYLRPDIYNQIDHWLDAHQVVEKQIIEKVVSLIQDLLASNGLEGQVYGRIKHKYSIYKKMQSQSLTLDEMHDIMAFRVLVKDIRDCYAVRLPEPAHHGHRARGRAHRDPDPYRRDAPAGRARRGRALAVQGEGTGQLQGPGAVLLAARDLRAPERRGGFARVHAFAQAGPVQGRGLRLHPCR